MRLPSLVRYKRHTQSCPSTSCDSLFLAQLVGREKASRNTVVILCSDALDAQRINDELVFFDPQLRCAVFPDWETLPYDTFSAHHDLVSERLATLWKILQGNKDDGLDAVLLSATTALYRLSPPDFLAAHTFDLKSKQKLNEQKLKEQFTLAGYAHVAQVLSPGEYAVRGGLIDFFPMGSLLPYRMDLFDNEIDSIRVFDPDTQRSLYPVAEVKLLPGKEFPMEESARQGFCSRWRKNFEGDPTKSLIYKDMANGVASPGIEYYLPFFFDDLVSFFDYLNETSVLVFHGDIERSLEQFWKDTEERFRMSQANVERPILSPKQLFLSVEQFFTTTASFAQLALRSSHGSLDTKNVEKIAKDNLFLPLPDMQVERGVEDPLKKLKIHIEQKNRILVVVDSVGRRESLTDFFRSGDIRPVAFDGLKEFLDSKEVIGITVANLYRGFSWLEGGIGFLTETDLFAGSSGAVKRRKKSAPASDVGLLIKDLSELNVGDPVVHINHGIGRYLGLIYMDLGTPIPDEKNPQVSKELQEFLYLEYADKALLYVPISQLHLISRYAGVSADEVKLHKLGGVGWGKAKRKAAEQVRDTAAELLNIYARRELRQGHAFRYSSEDYEIFSNDFGFEETPDQKAAIHAVIEDMVSPKPMDRLVCGDVGFGKTEVALRAAFVAVMGGKQVAFLAPTTLLVEQHFQTLTDRLAKWPIKVAELSRFRSNKEVATALAGLEVGTVDIVVGTHKLLSQKNQFKNLGLLIIDEEHRFGVRHKEQMKAFRAEVDVLTLTATPIPRTMGMALEGLRDLSVIATAPERRLAIKTFVHTENAGIIREAVLRELKRGGQVYFLHNEVSTMEGRQLQLAELLPEARIAIAHGQMPERQLESVMRNFVAQRYNLLLCSTIIETGIDVPTANTIIISRADKFGLAQLHQLRGRVGRSHHQAYAYLLVPDVQTLSGQAAQRLKAIESMEELGGGFYLAMHDLEIRGAGEILGENQSGNMLEIGFQLYNDMLLEAVQSLRSGKEPDLLSPLSATVDVNLHVPALLPADYCGDVHLRLSFYKKLASAKTLDQVGSLMEELADRFGQLPAAVHNLLDVHRLRILSTAIDVIKVDATPHIMVIVFKPNPVIEPVKIIKLIQTHKHIKLVGNERLRIERDIPEVKDRVHFLRDLFKQLK